MKRIDKFLSNIEESYSSKISRLENALVPFAQWVSGSSKPYYMGFAVSELGLKADNEGLHFLVNEKCVVTYFADSYKASVCEDDPFTLLGEDIASIEVLLKRLKAMNDKSKEEDKVLEDMPEEMQRILKQLLSISNGTIEVHRVSKN